ncbi:hypothetical protein, partial [Nostoc sp.]|uniref:hypothetical protein n=1 Tax=Nostoc sp. TaxID=1180 RepID=UPI002FF8F3B9
NMYPGWLSQHSTKAIVHLTESVLKVKPEITNPYIVKAILWTLSPAHINYASYWLSGLELAQSQAEEMGLPNPKSEDREAEALSTVRQILDITSYYRVPVICFDELDIADAADNGFLAAQVIASLVKDLYNSLKQGVLLLAMYPRTWEDQIKALPEAEAVIDRLASEQADRQPIALKYLNSDDIVALVSQWLQDFYEGHQQTPPHSLYPFDETKLRELGKSRPTVRSVLKWCAENFVPIKLITNDPPKKNIHLVKPCFDNELANVEASIDSLMQEEITISTALWMAFNNLIGETVEGVTIESIEEVLAKAVDEGFIDFKIVGNKGKVRIGVSVVQQDGKFIGAALKRLIDYKKFDLTRGCLVRSKNINQGAGLAKKHLRTLLEEKGGEWIGLQSQDIKPLLAIYFVCRNIESYELTGEQIVDFIEQNKLAINNPLIREILSDPSGQEPTNLTDDGLPISIPQPIANADNIELNL